MRKALVAANWKMHGSLGMLREFLAVLEVPRSVDVVLLPPAVFLSAAVADAPAGLSCGIQDIGTAAEGAHTGEVAAEMVAELGGRWAVVGHSERRLDHNEQDDLVATKAVAALRGGLQPIICVGETLAERQSGHEHAIVARQLEAVLDRVCCAELAAAAIGYEPVWAIGTGETATAEQAQEMHGFIRGLLAAENTQAAQSVRIVYGGSVKPENAAELFSQPDIDGGLVGGASLRKDDFAAIVHAAAEAGKMVNSAD